MTPHRTFRGSKRDFSKHRWFPGTSQSNWAGRVADGIERIPGPVFLAIVSLLAWACSRGRVSIAVAMAVVFLSDWVLIALLPRFRISHGPAKAQTLVLALTRIPFALLPMPWMAIAQLVGTALVVQGFWREPNRLGVTREVLRSSKLAGGPPLRLLHFGDLHAEHMTQREDQLVELAEQLRPDAIVFTGDFLSTSSHHDPLAHETCRWVFSRLHAPHGVFAVSGSPSVDREDVMNELLPALAVRWLRDERVRIPHGEGEIDLIGVSCSHKTFVDAPKLKALLADVESDDLRFRILLHHSPDLAPEAAEAGIDLQLSGHTHGGQVRVPGWGALFTASLYGKAFEMGRYDIHGMTLYVTRGVGMEGTFAPRVRFLCPPEIVLWELSG